MREEGGVSERGVSERGGWGGMSGRGGGGVG